MTLGVPGIPFVLRWRMSHWSNLATSSVLLVATAVAAGCQQSDRRTSSKPGGTRAGASAPGDSAVDTTSTGIGPRGIPFYTSRSFSARERDLLRAAFGVDDPQRLYLSDSSESAILKDDTNAKRCRTCYVDSYRVGFLSMRQRGETWDAFEIRLRGFSARDFPPSARVVDQSLDDLDPDARRAFADLLDAGRRAGFRLTVLETYRTPAREAMLFEKGHGRTYTTTSMHSYGRAVDIGVQNGRGRRSATRAEWVRFRRFVALRANGQFRLIGAVDRTWDWPHVEMLSPGLGFHSVDEALAFAARCTSDSARAHAPASADLGGGTSDPCVFVPHLADFGKR